MSCIYPSAYHHDESEQESGDRSPESGEWLHHQSQGGNADKQFGWKIRHPHHRADEELIQTSRRTDDLAQWNQESTEKIRLFIYFLTMETIRPKVGVWVIVRKDGKILLGKRINAHGDGTWCFPWWHLEFNESVEECAIRETLEEAGIKIKNISMGPFTNDIFHEEKKHYITLFVICDYDEWEPKVMEPEKCEKRERVERENFHTPLFLPIENIKKQGFHPYAQ